MKSGIRRIILVITGGILLFLVLETGAYNWRLLLSMRFRNLSEQSRQLRWKRDELLVEKAALLNPQRLHRIGTELGLVPLSLQCFSVLELDTDIHGSEQYVSLEQ